MVNEKRKFSVDTIFFLIAYTLYSLFIVTPSIDGIKQYRDIFLCICPIVIIICVFLKRNSYTKKDLMIMMIVLSISLIVLLKSKNYIIFFMIIFLILSKNTDSKQIIKYDLFMKLFFTFSIFILHFLGFTDNMDIFRADGKIRYSLGFFHPNMLGAYIFSLCLDYIYLRFERININSFIILSFSIFFIKYITDSRTSEICILLIILLLIIYKLFLNKIKIGKLLKIFISSSFILFTFFSYIFVKNYDENNYFMKKLDEKLSGRLYCISRYCDNYNINLFGNSMNELNFDELNEFIPLDNFYMKLLLNYGILEYIILAMFIFYIKYKAFNNHNSSIIILLTVIEVFFLMESQIEYTILILCAGLNDSQKREEII